MYCEYCQEEFVIKSNYIAKNCGCDDDYRFLKFENWYENTFNFDAYSFLNEKSAEIISAL